VTFSRRLAWWLSTAVAIFAVVSGGSAATGTVGRITRSLRAPSTPASPKRTSRRHLCAGLDGDRTSAALVHRHVQAEDDPDRHLPGRTAGYELDHYVPLEIGGHPTDPRNLWPQSWPEARLKDKLEYALNRAVCGNRMTVSAAQHCLLDQLWQACARRIGTPVP
jgi:hypothetical protein